ncbi:MAG: glycoside hydrolase family 127 protein [Bacteroidales bacterium]|nr:glycoside hydrolase family 127 protein [Bacteroidales bacterium]
MKLSRILIPTCLLLCACTAEKKAGYPIDPVPFTQVKVADGFWGQRLQASREVTIPLAFSKCEETGRYDNFVKAARQMHSETNLGFEVGGFSFDDTDVYKTIEGASYVLQTRPDARLEAYIDSVLRIVAAAQEPDGYLYTARTMNPEHPHPWAGDKRWSQEEVLSHELYNLGHMVEGAVAHYQATGKRNFLDIAIRYADCVVREVGAGEGQACVVPGHQIAEMALCRLYLVTGEKKYLDQARFFLDYRGKTKIRDAYSQSHRPVLEQDEAVGHAVRAAYMYAGMADVAALTGDLSYVEAIDRIWDNITSRKLYITGGIGATSAGEAFGANYELPNATSYCETCAAIGHVYVNHRMFLLHGDSKYYDVLERTLYNGLISGVSLDGGAFFYPNPLESDGSHQRQPWFGCACCPSNISRFIPSLPGYVYASKKDTLWVNLYMAGTLETQLEGKDFGLTQETSYPWSGDILLTVGKTRRKQATTLKLRIPGWVRGEVAPGGLYSYADGKKTDYSVRVNGEPAEGALQNGYFCIRRTWKEGDRVELHFDREPRLVKASEKVEANRGRLAVEMGPLVYCAEAVDNGGSVRNALLDPALPLTVSQDQALCGIDRIHAGEWNLIPYYAWNHRGPGEMVVWMRTD